jgi:dihydroflavonol-4-reductase
LKIFVTGGNGFIGSRVVRRLCLRGHAVRCLLRPASPTRRIDDLSFERQLGDLRDRASLERGLDGCSACIHLASVSSWEEIASPDLEATVVEGTSNLLAACAGTTVKRLVYISSAAAINGSAEPRIFDETSVFQLGGSGLRYAEAKHHAEQEVLAAATETFEPVVVNPAETYGPEDDEWVTAGAIRDVLRSWPALALRGGSAVAHVDDVAEGIVLALEKGRPGHRYILGGENLTVEKIVRTVLALAAQRKPVLVLPAALVRAAVGACRMLGLPPPVPPDLIAYASRYWFVDDAKARAELGYRPRPAVETLRSVVDWVLQANGKGGSAAAA